MRRCADGQLLSRSWYRTLDRLITAFGNYGRAAIIVSTISLVGIVAAPFFPETRGRPLPD